MTTAIAPGRELSKPRQAVLILEAAALAVALILLAWLALWLMRQKAQGPRVEAFHVPNGRLAPTDAPYPAADVKLFLGSNSNKAVPIANADGLFDAIQNVVSQPGAPAVVYVSSPALGDGPDARIGGEPLRALLEKVAQTAKRDVLLAVDLAQVDSDRDLGVYGNSPYQALAESLKTLKSGNRAIHLLTSSAPGQKSWGADSLGGSVFAHFLAEGLRGGAKGWDAPVIPGRISVQGLHRYVRDHVARWARDHRRASQTPMLLTVGDAGRPVALPFLQTETQTQAKQTDEPPEAATDEPDPPPPAQSKTEAADQSKDSAKLPAAEAEKTTPKKTTAPTNPRDRLLEDLLEEWSAHDALFASGPHHRLPASWRSYQSELLLAERALRSAWNVPDALGAARDDLIQAGRSRVALQERLNSLAKADANFPLRPAKSDDEGKRAVTEALLRLTGEGPDRALFLAPDPEPAKPAPEPAASDPAPGAPAKPPSPPKSTAKSLAEPPAALGDALRRGFPEPYLELQLPAWALRFAREFEVPDHFMDGRRGSLLRQLTQSRALAEDAMAVDHRGLAWIRPIIVRADESRRSVQDRLFGPEPATLEGSERLRDEIATISRTHETALRYIQIHHEARRAWENIAAELPELAEWSIRAGGRAGGRSLPPSPLPASVEKALDDAQALAAAVDQNLPPETANDPEANRGRIDELRNKTQQARESLQTLKNQLRDAVRSETSLDWTALDAALRTPLIPLERRRRLLSEVLNRGEPARLEPSTTASAPAADADANGLADSADPGFWSLAAGLAALDERLRRLGRLQTEPDDATKLIQTAWSAARRAPSAAETAAAVLPSLRAYEAAANRARDDANRLRAERGRAKSVRVETLRAALRDDDRAARLLCPGELRVEDSPADAIVGRWAAFAQYETLQFQLERLRRDYAPNTAELWATADALARAAGCETPRDAPTAEPTLALRSVPPAGSPLQIGEDGAAVLELGAVAPGEGDPSVGAVPGGRAFVGLAAPPPSLRISLGNDGGAAGEPPGVLADVGPSARAASPARFLLEQIDLSSNRSAIDLQAKLFYRGRIDPRGSLGVTVVPRSYAKLVVIGITHDPDDLETRFGPGAADRIEDQFKKHPGRGYMHLGKSASYRLTFTNVTFKPVTLVVKRSLVDPSNAEPPVMIDEEDRVMEIAVQQTVAIRGKVTSEMTPKGKPKDLQVAWSLKEEKEAKGVYKVRFEQIDRSRYMDIEPFIGLAKHDGVFQNCFAVRYRRRADDPVREPIMGDEVVCVIEGVRRSINPRLQIMPGDSSLTTQPCPPGANKFTWSGSIENEEIPRQEYTYP